MPRSLVAALLAAALLVTSAPAASAAIPPPASDPFYVPPAGFENAAPGAVLRQRSVTVTGLGIPIPVRSTQFLVRSSDAHDRPVAVASTLMLPLTPYPGVRPLLSYQQAIDSLGDQCNPSYTLRTGTMQELALLAQGLMRGWAVVTTDFQGPRNAYGAGRMAGHAVLDGIRAARTVVGSVPVGLWGYSGGGQATAWAAELAPSYAPELPLVGAAEGGVPADLAAVLSNVDGTLFSGVVFAAVFATSREYPELASLFNANGVSTASRIADMCQAEVAVALAGRRLGEFTTSADPLNEPVARSVLADNALGSHAPAVPVFLFHAYFDQLIPVGVGRQLKADYCAGGAEVLYYEDYVTEHIGLDVTAAPLAVSYLADRFAGRAVPSSC